MEFSVNIRVDENRFLGKSVFESFKVESELNSETLLKKIRNILLKSDI